MNNEPVAFVSKEDLKDMKTHLCDLHLEPQKNDIPLYTAPRELSDELPSPVLQEYFEKGYKCAMESLQLSDDEIKTLHDETSWWGVTDPVKFARAILKKASKK